ncbi:MAG: hypothetical protein ACI85O_001902, partial [Saprospiraceae bacterium]
RYFPSKNSSVATAMQRFFEENYRKNLSLKFIHINNVTYLVLLWIYFLEENSRKRYFQMRVSYL